MYTEATNAVGCLLLWLVLAAIVSVDKGLQKRPSGGECVVNVQGEDGSQVTVVMHHGEPVSGK